MSDGQPDPQSPFDPAHTGSSPVPPPAPGYGPAPYGAPGYLPAGYGGYGAPAGYPPKPENYLAWTIVTTILCCWPLGIPSIVYATRVDSAWARGDFAGAEAASRNAKRWMLVNVLSLLALFALFLALVVLGAVLGESGSGQVGTTNPTF